ncbi:Hypothetical predicted protein [Octopus vulgaris]|uniref:Uncharacterized protein n=1 Tax=Octopus vulgaris TaxID=6645 RepID=A0AA36B0M9_OCTVU|nr:Hypothetical predicted protein [Octopus vulgaris]
MESWILKMLDTLVSATYENEIRSSRISDRIMTIMSRLDWNTLCLTSCDSGMANIEAFTNVTLSILSLKHKRKGLGLQKPNHQHHVNQKPSSNI